MIYDAPNPPKRLYTEDEVLAGMEAAWIVAYAYGVGAKPPNMPDDLHRLLLKLRSRFTARFMDDEQEREFGA